MKDSYYYLLGLIFVTSILRIIELRIAKSNLDQRKSSTLIQVKEPFFFLFVVLHSSFLIIVPLEAILLDREFNFIIALSSISVYFICLLLRFHILFVLGKFWNTKIIYEKEIKEGIITNGIYKYIRHPNYLVVILEIASISLFHSSYYSFIFFSIFNFILLFFRIKKEENALFQNDYYSEHFQNKKRFIPYLF
ncbi:MAG: isoprenylcysteine carboxylmethyltransferase family protein [Leptospiraceae bacterium]|nr:isoprenylcysteine carboxylmethyltransferase family protein [Leptospiraceae bacterium]